MRINYHVLIGWGNESVEEWPIRGDYEGIYFQVDPGKYSIKVDCTHCDKTFYVVWDDNPGPVKPLDMTGVFK